MADWFGYAYIHELPDDGSQEHEVYARFGLAAYAAQTFEIGMVNLLTVAGLTESTAANSMDEQFAALMGKTAGALLRDVHEAGHLSDDERETCRDALKIRNSTIHGFFYRHAADFQHPAGRQTMVEEADAARMTLESAYHILLRLTWEQGAPRGITPQKVQTYMDALVDAVADEAHDPVDDPVDDPDDEVPDYGGHFSEPWD